MRNRSLVKRKGREGRLRRRRDKEELVGRGEEGGVRLKKKEEERGRRGKSDSQKRGAVVLVGTGNRPSYVH